MRKRCIDYNANGRWFQVLSISGPAFVHFFSSPGIQWPYAAQTGGDAPWIRIWMTGSSAGKAPRRATADTRLLPLCADGCARRFFRLRAAAQPVANAPRARGVGTGARWKFGVFTEHCAAFLFIKTLTKREAAAILKMQRGRVATPQGAALLQ